MEGNQPKELIISMEGKLGDVRKSAADQPWEKWSIYRVPRRLRDAHDSKVYVPQTVSIGPYHHADKQVHCMDRHKWIALNRTLERTGHHLGLYIDAIKKVEKKARKYYQQDLGHLSSDEFVEMILLDACFILELFRCSPKVVKCNDSEVPLVFHLRMIDDILLDMVMLENQIPLFVLDTLLGLGCMVAGYPNEEPKEHAVSLALNLFNSEWLTGAPLQEIELKELKSSLQSAECLHVLDVFRRSLLHHEPQHNPSYPNKSLWRLCDKLIPECLKKRYHTNQDCRRRVIHRVAELREAGVKFRKRNTSLFWDIEFKNGVLEIPSILIHDGTKSILLNLAAFEQCHLEISDAVVASYAIFMECLIKSSEDVSYLLRHGIIQHLLGHDDEVVDMLKCVSREMLVDANGGHYARLTEEVNTYCDQRWNRWRASFLHRYFKNPWTVTSLVAAVLLLALTALQTFYTVYSFYKQKLK
ncbi:hypothetical protein RND81_04G102200 [Saponaria officinalis]|uniref:Uncharacterized protein n=1 Tax=Saponaria officinalis TaxID=3572 RepID=A0AAW1LE03_SAPOF